MVNLYVYDVGRHCGVKKPETLEHAQYDGKPSNVQLDREPEWGGLTGGNIN